MVILGKDQYVDEYCCLIEIWTETEYFQIITRTPRRNKWITPYSVDTFRIIYNFDCSKWKKSKVNIRNIPKFLHSLKTKYYFKFEQ